MRKIFFVLMTFFIAVLTTKAQSTINLVGQVEDAFLQVALPQAKVTVYEMDSMTVVIDSAQTVNFIGAHGKVSMMQYYAPVPTKVHDYLVCATLKGYGDEWQKASVTNPKANQVDVPTIKMRRMRQIDLDNVTVTATKIKMYYRGDTIVYDADAFQLPDGSMLDDLIRQMEGVTMNEQGEIFVNGRKIDELLLGSRSFMGGNTKVLMENLPYYTVKNIKVYEKQTDRSVALGYEAEPARYVMDVNLKEEYNRGYIANVEAAAGTDDRWLGRGFVLGYTDYLRLSLVANANNVNEGRHIGQSGHWTPSRSPRSMVTTRGAAGELFYANKGEKLKDALNVDYASTSEDQHTRQRREQFLYGSTPVSLTESANYSKSWRLSASNELTINKPFYLKVRTNYQYTKRNSNSSSLFDQWGDTLTASQRTVGLGEGSTMNAFADVNGTIKLSQNKRHINYSAYINRNIDQSEQATRYATQQFATGTLDTRHNAADIDNRRTSGRFGASYEHHWQSNLNLYVSDDFQFSNINTHDYLYHPDTLTLVSQLDALTDITDPTNSYDSRYRNTQNGINLVLTKYITYRPFENNPATFLRRKWELKLDLPVRHETLDYHRGALDTLATQSSLLFNAEGYIAFNPKDAKRYATLTISHNSNTPNLNDRITYRDDRQPLVVKLGNPDLKNTARTRAQLYFLDTYGSRQRRLALRATFTYVHRDVAQSSAYNPLTGVYTYRPENVSGAYTIETRCDYGRAIDEQKRWTWQTNADVNFHHTLDHAMLANETHSRLNTVNTLTLHDGGYIQYNKGELNIRATGDVRITRPTLTLPKGEETPSDEGQSPSHLGRDGVGLSDFQYGINARYTLPVLKTTISADANMYSRRGYGSAELNTDDFVINCSLSQSLMKGKLIARVECFDLLHNLSNTHYEVNAQGRIETWYRSLPHYVMAHLVYHWSKTPKKK